MGRKKIAGQFTPRTVQYHTNTWNFLTQVASTRELSPSQLIREILNDWKMKHYSESVDMTVQEISTTELLGENDDSNRRGNDRIEPVDGSPLGVEHHGGGERDVEEHVLPVGREWSGVSVSVRPFEGSDDSKGGSQSPL